MCGPLAAAQSQRSVRHPGLRYQVGRVVSYTALGALAGGSGHALRDIGGRAAGIALSLSLAAGLVALAISLWRPAASAPQPIPIGRRRRPLIARAVAALRPGPLGLGFLSALLPCGALWAALAIAAGSGRALAGALTMLGFACASSIGLLASGWLARALRRRSALGRRLLASLLVAGALVIALRPLAAGDDDLPPCHRAMPESMR
jgi:hypothetical protein